MSNALASCFEEFVESLDCERLSVEIARVSGFSASEVLNSLRTGAAEARYSLRLLQAYPLDQMRILEIGSGTGLLGFFLVSRNIDVHMVEPGGLGFDLNAAIFRHLGERLRVPHERTFFVPVTGLPQALKARFDLIFSNNVLEHVSDLEGTLTRLNDLLAPSGVMLHNCPNYLIPFEPHYGIPLVPLRPALTKYLLSKRIVNDGCWRSLNFVTSSQVKRIAKTLSGNVRFREGIVYDVISRLQSDAEFRGRHPLLAFAYDWFEWTGLFRLAKALPASWATPMIFEWRR